MAKLFLTGESKAAFSAAVRTVEAASSAELVVAVRQRSGSYLHVGLAVGILAGLAALAVLLFSSWDFELIWFLVDPVLAGVIAGLVFSRSPLLSRAFTRRTARRGRVETAARSVFVERRVHSTSGRTGILLYLSLLEREAVLVVDLAVEALAATDAWRAAAGEIEAAMRRGASGAEVAAKVSGLAAVLGPVLPRSENDVDELPNEVC
jgi:putative membrane protein